jgi:hypothetical protein
LNYGFYYAGTSQVRGATFYTFCNEKDGLVAFVPMIVSTVREAKAALSASLASYLVCADRWKRPLDQLLRETKSHLDELSDGTVVAVPEGFVLETPEETAAEEAKKAQRIAK